MFTGSAATVVELVPTVQVKPTLVPPLPDPLHWPTVAAVTEVTPGVLTGVQLPGAPGPVMTDPMHWYTVAGVDVAVPEMLLVIVTVQISTPPPPFAEPSHCVT